MYFAIILCPNFRVLETARILWHYKYKEKVECLPLALSSKPYVVVLQTTARKCIKACATCAHLARKNTYPGIKSNCCTSPSKVAAYAGIKFRGLQMERKTRKMALKCFCALHNGKTGHFNVVEGWEVL